MKRKRKPKIKWKNVIGALVVLSAAVFVVWFAASGEMKAFYERNIAPVFESSKQETELPLEPEKTPDEPEGMPDDTPDEPEKTPEDEILPPSAEVDDIAPHENPVSLEERDGLTYLTIEGHEMLLVNKAYGLPEDFGGPDDEANAALSRLYAGAAEDGISLWTVSGYRSYSDQKSIHDRFVAERGEEGADLVSADPGHSEHQTGMAFDVNSLSTSFGSTPEGIWLAENMAEYGFILRYPESKTDWTGYAYEPWHIRYVGIEIAKILTESGLTVEEYMDKAGV